MPITLKHIASKTGSVAIAINDEDSAQIRYRTNLITEQRISVVDADLADTNSEKLQTEGYADLNQFLADIIVSWDIYEDDAMTQMAPITKETIADLGLPSRLQLYYGIIGDTRPNKTAPTQTPANSFA